ncbi:MAG TPA: hypothetical protein VE172_04665 [Stackebrandtia sp.]|uniref:hypothetical protein n=1 Tax=Stackebrandtia sp. TaxID=2023065 RepID=UPI002D2BADC2|nr:hypothetical protein [Stackebrandtia sp.]HZE38086.1 hypothetical protein [Stackebrandtia sp.]
MGLDRADLAGLCVPYLVFLVFTVVVSYLFTWVYNNASGSGPIAILLHTLVNASLLPVLFPGVANSLTYEFVQDLAFGLVAAILLLATRGRLGHTAGRRTTRSSGDPRSYT